MAMTENSRKVLEYLQTNSQGNDLTAQFIAQELEISVPAVTGSVNGMVRKGFAYREEVVLDEKDEKGKDKVVKFIRLTDAGLEFVPEAVEVEAE